MSKIDNKIETAIEDLFDMRTGYVIDFSNSTFQNFIKGSVGIDIYNDTEYKEYTSKANKLRQILNTESENKVVKLINDLIDYYEDYKLKNNKLTEYDKKKINQIKEYIKEKEKQQISKSFIDDDLNEKIIMISTRNAKFEQMTVDEKLKEISNLIEFLLKENGKFIDINFEDNSLSYLNNELVKKYRKTTQCFRHSSKESIIEREFFNIQQKKFMIDFGVTITNFIYNELNKE